MRKTEDLLPMYASCFEVLGFGGRTCDLLLAVCPECGMLEPYVDSPKRLMPTQLELDEMKPPEPKKEAEKPKEEKKSWFRKKKDDPWE